MKPKLSQRAIDAIINEILQKKLEEERKQREKEKERIRIFTDKYKEFQEQYFDDPAAFFLECVDWQDSEPAEYQLEAVTRLSDNERLAVCGPRGLGKSTTAALTIWWFALTRDGKDWKIPTTASSWTQLSKYLWPEVHKWFNRIKWDKIGRPKPQLDKELLQQSIKLYSGEAFATASNNPKRVEGAHADHILYVFDEAKEIPIRMWDSVEGAMSVGKINFLAISTPGEELGRFYDIHSRKPGYDDWDVMKVTYDRVAKARGEEFIKWAEKRKTQWGEQSAVYKNYVLGEFAQSDEGAIIPLGWIEKAIERYKKWEDKGFPGEYRGLGVDVGLGGKGSDKITIAECYDDYKIKDIHAIARANPETATMEVVGRVKALADSLGGGKVNGKLGGDKPLVVDIIGIGAGVGHRLSEQGYRVVAFNAGSKPKIKIKDESGAWGFADNRTAMWMLARELLDPQNNNDVCLPDIPELIGDLTSVREIKYMSGALMRIQSKADIRKELGRSTDYADAVLQILTGYNLCKKPDFKIYVVGQGEVQ